MTQLDYERIASDLSKELEREREVREDLDQLLGDEKQARIDATARELFVRYMAVDGETNAPKCAHWAYAEAPELEKERARFLSPPQQEHVK
jgi:hypothetical protein